MKTPAHLRVRLCTFTSTVFVLFRGLTIWLRIASSTNTVSRTTIVRGSYALVNGYGEGIPSLIYFLFCLFGDR